MIVPRASGAEGLMDAASKAAGCTEEAYVSTGLRRMNGRRAAPECFGKRL
jgi:hypothetical protein